MIGRRLAAAAAVVAIVALSGAPAEAEVDGGCTASVAGTDVTDRSSSSPGDAVKVDKDARVEVEAVSPEPITGYEVQLEFLGFRWKVAEGSANGNSWSRSIDVADYSKYGAGLYKVVGVSHGPGACTGSALVRIEGNGLLTPAGAVGVVLAGLGLAGIAFATRSAAQAVIR